jgi:hypothetical protein
MAAELCNLGGACGFYRRRRVRQGLGVSHACIARKLQICLGLLCGIHAVYLFFIIDATLRDLSAQRIVEQAMARLAHQDRVFNGVAFKRQFTRAMRFRGFRGAATCRWHADRHGLWGQVMLTALCVAAWWASVEKPKPQGPPAPAVEAGGTYCQGCTQYFTLPQPAIANPPSAGETRKPAPTSGAKGGR